MFRAEEIEREVRDQASTIQAGKYHRPIVMPPMCGELRISVENEQFATWNSVLGLNNSGCGDLDGFRLIDIEGDEANADALSLGSSLGRIAQSRGARSQ